MPQRRTAIAAILLCTGLSARAHAEPPAADPETPAPTLTILSVDATTLPGMKDRAKTAPPPAWRTSFGSERRSAPERMKPAASVAADLVLLQGVRDVPTLRQWFPAREWKLVVSRQLLIADATPDQLATAPASPVPTTAIAVRYQPGLRVTAQDHLMNLTAAGGADGPPPAAAGTAVRIQIAGRETWALSVLLPEACFAPGAPTCPGFAELEQWHARQQASGVRRVTGGRFTPPKPEPTDACARFAIRLDPAPQPPKPQLSLAAVTPELGCSAAVTVTK